IAAVRLPNVRPDDLRAAWGSILQRARIHQHHLISREQLSVRDQMSHVLRMVKPGRYVEFTSLFSAAASVALVVVTFLAIRALSREGLIDVVEAGPFAAIH